LRADWLTQESALGHKKEEHRLSRGHLEARTIFLLEEIPAKRA